MSEQIKQKPGSGYFSGLQALRGIAMLVVFLCHSGVLPRGAMSISIFFVLSGFLTAYHCNRRGAIDYSLAGCLRFSLRRIRKLYPLYFLTLIFYLSLLLRSMMLDALPGARLSDVALSFVLNVVLMQAWVPLRTIYGAYNVSAWFLSVLMFLYSVSPLVLNALRCLSVQGLLRTALIICIIYCVYSFCIALTADKWIPLYAREWFLYISPLYRLGDYLIGCCLGCLFPYVSSLEISKRKAAAVEIAVIALTVFTFVLYTLNIGFLCRIGLGQTVLPLPAAVLLVFFTALDRGGILSCFNNRLIRFFGGISGPAFLIHFPVLTACGRLFPHLGLQGEGNPLYVITALVLTIMLSQIWNGLNAKTEAKKLKTGIEGRST